MAGKGGYQQPTNPAVVSGPGALSARTDGSPTQPATYIPGMPWGQGGQTYANQTSAPMEGNPFPQVSPDVMAGAVPTRQPIGLNEPTMNPEEPGTAGINRGAGGGSELMIDLPKFKPNPMNTAQKVALFDDSGMGEIIYQAFLERQ